MNKQFLIRILLRTIGHLPLQVGRYLGSALGRLSWLVQDRGAKVTARNIALCFPEKAPNAQRELARQSMRETGKLAVEICQVWHQDKPWLDSKITRVTGQKVLESAIAKNCGVIILAPHLGNWEILGLWLLGFERRCTYLYQPPKQPFLEPLMKAARERFGAETVPTSRRGILELLKRLKNGEITGILPDQVPDEGGGQFSDFFGRPAYTMTLVHGLMQRTGCAVVFGVAVREANGFHVHISEPPEGIYDKDVAVSLRALNAGTEACIALAPAQYQWEYKRFKAGIDGKKLYR